MSVINSIPLIAAGDDGYQISRSVRLRSSASAYLSRTPAVAGNRKTWTWSGWVKRGKLGASQTLIDTRPAVNVTQLTNLYINASDALVLGNGASDWRITTQVFRDPSAWFHLVCAFDSTNATANNRVRIYVNGSEITSFSTLVNPTINTDYGINQASQHCIGALGSGASSYFDGYLTEVNFIDGQALTPASFGETDGATSVWRPKKYLGTYGTNGFYLPFTNTSTAGGNGFTYSEDFSNAAWTKYQATVSANATTAPNGTTTADKLIETATTGDHQVTRTFSATDNTAYTWSSYAKAGERSNFRMYLQNKAGSYNYADFDLSGGTVSFTSGVTAAIASVGSGWYRCSVSCNAGTGATASPAAILSYSTGTNGSGTNGLYIWGAQLEGSTSVAGAYYSTTSAGFGTYQIGADQSLATGGYNSWVANNISVTAGVTYDSMLDSPTPYADGGNGRGNYCVLNPLHTTQSATVPTNGNLTSPANSGVWRRIGGSMQLPTSGKFYFEYVCDSYGTYPTFSIGVFSGALSTTNGEMGYTSQEWGYNAQTGVATNNNTSISSGFTTATTGDVLQLAYDSNTGSLWFGKNNTWQGASSPNPSTGTSPTYTGVYNVTPVMVQNWATQSANFGQRPFAYTPPTGFKALNTQNLPEATIKKGNAYFDVSTYTGNGSTQSIVNNGAMQPDFVWLKKRSASNSSGLFDSVRGVNKLLYSDLTNAESSFGSLTAFNSNGFSLSTGGEGNDNGATYVGWQWKESASAGFDIVTYTGTGSATTVAHNLGVAPSMIIIKSRSLVSDWPVYHKSIGNTGAVLLNTTGATSTSALWWNNTSPTSSVFTLGTIGASNTNGATQVAYLFAEVAGFSKFGSYTGNGSADGPFVYLGFRPRFVLVKSTGSEYWYMVDTARDIENPQNEYLLANTSGAETTYTSLFDFNANGFKIRGAAGANNTNAVTYIYAAFAENPFKNSLAR